MNYKLFNKNIIKIIDSFGNEDKPLYFNQISALSGITSKNNLIQNLNLLVSLNILKREQNKSNTFYILNTDNPIASSLINFIKVASLYTLARDKWYSQNCNSTPITIMSAGGSGFFIKEKTSLSYTGFLYEFKEDFGRIAYSVKDLKSLSGSLLAKLDKNELYFEELKNIYDEDLKVSEAFYEELLSKNLSNLSDYALSNYLKRASQAINTSVGVGHLIEPFAIITDEKLKIDLSVYIKDEKKLNELFVVLTTPIQKSFSQESENLLIEIYNAKNKEPLIKDYISKFFWIKNSYSGRHKITKEEILEQSKLIKNNKANSTQDLIKKKELITKELKLNKKIVSHLKAIEFITYWQDERKKNILIAIDYLDRLLEELSKRVRIDIKFLRYLTPKEASKGFHHIMDLKEELENRRKGCLCFQIADRIQIVTKEEYLGIKELLEEKETKEVKILNGNAASLGRAIGPVKICTTIDSINKVKEGDILVASMTRPEYLSAMKKAAAFITDEGGITCHAAIVAREMRKPCVIGTKNATRVLHDGDIVEVKATHGVIIIRQRNMQ